MNALYDRLDPTPEQERALRDAFQTMRSRGREARVAAEEARHSFAKVLRDDAFDELALGDAQARIDDAFDKVKSAFIDAAAKVHQTLDARQRRIVADVVVDGPRALFRRRRPAWEV